MSDRNECSPGDYDNFAAVKAQHDAANSLLVATQAAVESAAVDGLVNIQMARGPVVLVDLVTPGEAHPPTINGRFVTPGPLVLAAVDAAVRSIIRGDATLAL